MCCNANAKPLEYSQASRKLQRKEAQKINVSFVRIGEHSRQGQRGIGRREIKHQDFETMEEAKKELARIKAELTKGSKRQLDTKTKKLKNKGEIIK